MARVGLEVDRPSEVSCIEVGTVPFNRPYLTGSEAMWVRKALDGRPLSGGGEFAEDAERLLRDMLGTHRVLLTGSCTGALDMSAVLLDIGPGDEVVVPSFAFSSTANAFASRGAVPVFVDCRPDTLNLDERLVEASLTPQTKAIVALHYAGVACDMDTLEHIARHRGLAVVEDNAHGLGGSWRGRALGSFGALATLSFHATKNVQCGEGGALVVNDPALADRAEVVRDKGTDRGRFLRGEVDRYTWVDLGSSHLPSELSAAFLAAQLAAFDDIQAARHRVWNAYHHRLAPWAAEHGVATPTIPLVARHAAHVYWLLLPTAADRRRLLDHMRTRGVSAASHYQPLHTSPAGRRHGRTAPGGCPVTIDISQRLARLPLYPDLSEAEVDRVIAAVQSFPAGR